MSYLRVFSALILGCCLAPTGCVVDAQEPAPFEAEDLEVPLEETGFGVNNGLLPSCYWNHYVQLTLRNLATAPIANSTGVMPAMPNMAFVPAGCWLAIKDLVECALPATMSVTTPGGTTYSGL